MRIGLIYDLFEDYPWRTDDPPDADAEYEPEATVAALEAGVRALGHNPVRIGTAHDLLQHVQTMQIDAAINIAEGARHRNREGYVPTLLEMHGIPFLGSDALTLSLSLDKAWTKDLAHAAGVPTPAYRVYAHPQDIQVDDLPPFPLFVKPRYEGSSKGISAKSRVENVADLHTQVAFVTQTYQQPALVETFIDGPEFTVAVIGHDPPHALPVLQRALETHSRIGLHALERRGAPAESWTYDLGGHLNADIETALQTCAVQVYNKLECKDFARADFRLDRDGVPQFLEINPLPTFAPDGTFAILAELMGRSYSELLAEVIRRGLNRLNQIA